MAIYKMVGEKERLERVAPTSFGQEGVLERQHLQQMLQDKPEVLEEGLLIISEEFSSWHDSNLRIDLLGLDSQGCLVVIELKRTDSGDLADLQAVRYAAMVANMTLEQAIATHQAYLNRWNAEEDAGERIQQHLDSTDAGEIYTAKPRIMLVSAGFSSELTTTVLWLNDSGLDIKCVRLQLYRSGSEILVEASQVIPLPEAEDYLVRIRERESEVQEQQHPRTVRVVSGGDAFKVSIRQIPVEGRALLSELCEWADCLAQDGLAELSTVTFDNGRSTRLELKVPGKDQQLVAISNNQNKFGSIWFRPDNENLAPESMGLLDELIGTPRKSGGMRYRTLSRNPMKSNLESVKSVVRDIYQEAQDTLAGGDEE